MGKAIAGIATAVVVVALAVMYWLGTDSGTGEADKFAQCRASSIGTGVSSIGGPLSLVDETGADVTEADMFQKPTLLYFGYTFCPDVCPLDNARNAEALDMLVEKGIDAQMAFVSIDPERDTPERMAEFSDFLHERMTGYTGTMEQIKAASRAYKTYFKKEDNADPEYYLVDHSTFTYLILPGTGFVEFFKRDEPPAAMAERVACFIAADK